MTADANVTEKVADRIARARGYVQGACVEEHYRDAREALAVLSGPEVLDAMGEVLWEHRAYPTGSPHCKCGWRPALHLNDTESDRRQHHDHQAAALADRLRGQG